MKSPLYRTAFALLLMTGSSAVLAAATVTYVNPARMTDVPRFGVDREFMQAELIAHLNTLSSRLPAGQNLNVEILDIDLAGDVFPRVAIPNVRVLKGRGDWPRIHMRYSIEQDGKVVGSGERRLVDTSYLTGSNRYGSDTFAHEKQLLDEWFRKDVVAAARLAPQ